MHLFHTVCLKVMEREDFREAGSYLVYEDVEQAKEIEKAGYDKNHPLPPITILYNTSELHKAIAEAVQDAWHKCIWCRCTLTKSRDKRCS